jgi:hypothetical protein
MNVWDEVVMGSSKTRVLLFNYLLLLFWHENTYAECY